ncbi:MAG: M50 family metallopeptidase [Deltaproteobacteria bacterium]|nr:M50 family metallopeptidase [Deltaproteobacteria bacterium]MBK8235200.1 M50 family metallopeptidase [Deltaproteobacteria bacterium]MBK8716480.1 M50 family metallopeptidase [Deltaproteobacteria bacterium]MBP7287330.1 M50 family metallopeptidase [Nannocystaceae bacterium]
MGSRQLSDWLEDAAARRRARAALKWSVVLTLALYLIPFGALLAYPLLLLSTLFHELGHGVAAMLTGGRFESLVMYADGSGVASHSGSGGAVTHAITAAGGLLGPAIVAAIAFASGRSRRGARAFLWLTAIGLVLALALFVRNGFGIGFTAVVAGVLVWLAVRGNAASAQLGAVFLATQLALSVFSRADYLFTDVAATAVGNMPSDTAVIAQALGGTYWIWGLVCGLFSLAVLAAGVLWFLRAFREPARVLHR